MQRWVLSNHNTATLIADFKRGIGLYSWKGSKDLSPKRILDDESAVIKYCDSINNWKNPFEDSESLFCLSSGIFVCHEVEEDMFNAENIGRRRLESFSAERTLISMLPLRKNFEEQKKIVTLQILNNSISI